LLPECSHLFLGCHSLVLLVLSKPLRFLQLTLLFAPLKLHKLLLYVLPR
jgi:hypothetical protein